MHLPLAVDVEVFRINASKREKEEYRNRCVTGRKIISDGIFLFYSTVTRIYKRVS